ncbi:MAG: EAL domain-containing protein [Burkholderiales bacterium]|nr:EAL domain-containing protein [Burkholderiales bacterium]MDE2398748.1 EAL domain-containing protein [Burkholderiales bacterium]MDE2452996.1 EAL domain-containing protein [Burkholderiales bacterium]
MPNPPDSLPVRVDNAWLSRRVRRAMYAAFAAIAALALFVADATHRHEKLRAADTALIDIVAGQSSFAAQIGRIVALGGVRAHGASGAAARLGETLERSRAEAARAVPLLESLAGEGAASAPQRASAAWQAANTQLWQAGEAWSRLQQAGVDDLAAKAAAQLQDDADASIRSSTELVQQLKSAAHARSRGLLGVLDGGVAATLVLLGLLALAVVEPTARAVRSQVRRLDAQREELERRALVAARTENLVVVANADCRVEWVNDAFVRRSGYGAEEVLGRRPGRLMQAALSGRAAVRAVRHALARGEGLRTEIHCRAKTGEEYWLDLDIQPLRDAQGNLGGFVTVGTDISERRRLQEQLQLSSHTDALTGLPNRAVVVERVQRALEHAARHPEYGFAVLFMDFDRFKQVNDTLGHSAGDELLRQIARRVVDTLRPGDAVARIASQLQTAARIGGDEFVVVLEGVRDAEDVAVIAERLLGVLADPYTIEHHAVHSSASIGIVTSGHTATSADELLRDADTAMYEAKRAGRGRFVIFDSTMHERVVQALEIETDLRRALRDHELFVVYQPVVELGSGAMAGVEALVRWRHPTRGVVPPARFIGVAEEVGLIDAIGQEVLQLACSQFARWREELGPSAPRQLALNLSRAQLTLPGLVPEVRWMLDENGLQPHELQFEITESLAAQDPRVQATLRELKALGVKLALDDFGTGYSSLACLHQLPVDTVKIDRSFVVHAETVEYHRVLIEATIRVAQALGMATVAEGIETAGQAALMAQLHCDRGQGYLFARPLGADDFARWVRASAPAGA